jgi:hypothetical protein
MALLGQCPPADVHPFIAPCCYCIFYLMKDRRDDDIHSTEPLRIAAPNMMAPTPPGGSQDGLSIAATDSVTNQ